MTTGYEIELVAEEIALPRRQPSPPLKTTVVLRAEQVRWTGHSAVGESMTSLEGPSHLKLRRRAAGSPKKSYVSGIRAQNPGRTWES